MQQKHKNGYQQAIDRHDDFQAYFFLARSERKKKKQLFLLPSINSEKPLSQKSQSPELIKSKLVQFHPYMSQLSQFIARISFYILIALVHMTRCFFFNFGKKIYAFSNFPQSFFPICVSLDPMPAHMFQNVTHLPNRTQIFSKLSLLIFILIVLPKILFPMF